MDSFMNIAKQGYEAYQEHHSRGNSPSHGGQGQGQGQGQEPQYSKTGGAEYNPSHYSGGGPSFNDDEVVRNAQHHSSGAGDSSLFSSAMGFLNQNKGEHNRPVDEADVQDSHRKAYQEGSSGGMNASSLGSAAAMQVLKSFTSGGHSSGGGGGGGGSQSQLISMAMAEASKLFDKSGGGGGGNKQDAVNGAAMTVMKLLVQSKVSGTTGGGNSGGLGGLMSLASKFA